MPAADGPPARRHRPDQRSGGTPTSTSVPRRAPGRSWSATLAALVAFGLGSLAAVMMVVGHQPWDGPELLGLTATHGVHLGDALSVVPFAIGCGLAWWCLGQWSPADVADLLDAQAPPVPPRRPDDPNAS